MSALTRRMENSRAWWQSEITRRNDRHAEELKHSLAGFYAIALIVLAVLQTIAGHV